MKTFEEIKSQIEPLKGDLHRIYGVSRIEIFGSYVRGEQLEESDLDLIVSGNQHSILMIEGFAREMPEDMMLEAIANAHQHIREICEMQTELMEKLVPRGKGYHHDATWGDGNGYAHLRSALLGTSFVVSFSEKRPHLGTWQQVVFLDFDNRPRDRAVVIQVMGE